MVAQKWAIQQCNQHAVPIFIQSQILETMCEKDQPSRQELTEITSTTLDGADAFIMCHETSNGSYSLEAVTSLAKGIAEAENVYDYEQAYTNIREGIKHEGVNAASIDILTTTACKICFEKDSDVDMLVCLTENGKIARHLGKQRPKQPILACSTNGQIVR